jgi:heme oxygenase
MLLQIPSSHYQPPLPSQNHTSGSFSTGSDNSEEDAMNEIDDDTENRSVNPVAVTATTTTTTITTPFLKVLQELHAVAGTIATTTTTTSITLGGSNNTTTTTNTTTNIPIPTKCPVFHTTTVGTTTTTQSSTNSTPNTTTTNTKFTHVIMDGYSLSEIMARLAKQMEEEEEEEEEEEGNNDSESTTSPVHTITETPVPAASMAMETWNSHEDKNPTIESTPLTSMATTTTATTTTTKSTGSTTMDKIDDIAADDEKYVLHPTNPTTLNKLSVTMKTGTAASHIAAENVYFVRNFIRGQIDPTLFAALTQQLFYVYRTLEYHLLSRHALPSSSSSSSSRTDLDANWVHVQQFYKFHQALQRTESLKEDLDYWFGSKEAEAMIQYEYVSNLQNDERKYISPATRDYLQRIQYCAQHSPYLLLAHSYTRYLGDLSGGKILARVARKALQLSSTDDGLAFYDFTATITNTKQFKDEYRTSLDQLDPPLTSHQIQQLVAEANIAFVLNMRIFEELDVMANIPNAMVRPYEEAIRPYMVANSPDPDVSNPDIHVDRYHQTNNSSNSHPKEIPKECPFAKMNSISTSFLDPNVASTKHHTATKSSPLVKSNNGAGGGKRCPWPFILFHDPQQFVCDWQTWMTFGLLLCWLYHQMVVVE